MTTATTKQRKHLSRLQKHSWDVFLTKKNESKKLRNIDDGRVGDSQSRQKQVLLQNSSIEAKTVENNFFSPDQFLFMDFIEKSTEASVKLVIGFNNERLSKYSFSF